MTMDAESPPVSESGEAQVTRLQGYLLRYWPTDIESNAVDTAIKLLERYRGVAQAVKAL